jgi:hypothetical protein
MPHRDRRDRWTAGRTLLYAAALDEALPLEGPGTRSTAARCRLAAAVRASTARGDDPSIVYPGLYGVIRAPAEVVEDLLTMERELLVSGGPPDRETLTDPFLPRPGLDSTPGGRDLISGPGAGRELTCLIASQAASVWRT